MCSQGIPAYVLFVVCLRLGNWDDLVEGKLEKVFVMHLGWGQRVKGDHSRFSVTELGMRLGTGSGVKEREV